MGKYRTQYKSKTARKPYVSKTKRTKYKSKSYGGERSNAKSFINKMRDLLLGANKVLGDINAVHKGTITDRIIRRVGGKAAGKGLGILDKK